MTALLALGAILVGCGGGNSGTPAPAGTYKILMILPYSGPVAFLGQTLEHGLQAAQDVINASGGINGHQVEFKHLDDAADGSKAVTALQTELATNTKYNQIIPGVLGSEALALAPVLAANPSLQTTIASETVLNDPAKYPNLFSMGTGFVSNGEGLAAQLKKDKIARVAILGADDPTGHNGAEATKTAAQAAGISATVIYVRGSAADATPELQQAKDFNPQALVVTGFSAVTGPILKARTKLGWTIPLYADAFAAAADFPSIATPADLKGVIVQTFPFLVAGNPTTQSPTFKAFLTAIQKYEPHPTQSLIIHLTTYNALMVARAAAKKANSIEGASLVKGTTQLQSSSDVPGWIGVSKLYSQSSHFPFAPPGDFVYVAAGPRVDGQIVPTT